MAGVRHGARDCLGVFAYPVPGVVAVVCLLLDEPWRPRERAERKDLRRVSAHLDGGLRLRLRPDAAVVAVLAPNGRLLDARDDAVARRRHQLADEVRSVERARDLTARGDPDALVHWRALVDGQFTVVPRGVGHGRREYLFVDNGAVAREHARLSPREGQVLRLVARGYTQKEAAYAFGVSDGTVSAALERARVRLGLPSRIDLVRVARACFGAPGTRLEAAPLTAAEREVLGLVRQGLSNADIARLRGASRHTVANQVASILRKTAASGRRELAARPVEASEET